MARHNENEGPETLVGISFDDAFRAQEFLTAATRLAAQGHLILKDAVTVTKTVDGQTTVRETIDPQPKRSALSGAVWTGLIGLLVAGPAGWVAGLAVGAGAGAVAAKVVDLGIPDEWVSWFRQARHRSRSLLRRAIGLRQPRRSDHRSHSRSLGATAHTTRSRRDHD